MRISIEVDDKLARAALQHAPEVIERAAAAALERGADEVARAARENAAKRDLFGTLKQSIHVERPEPLRFVVATGTNYARAVEEGTGPAAGKARYFPDWTALIPYVKTHATRGGERLKRAGSAPRFFQEREFENRAFQLARYISHHGTKSAPFMKPALDEKESRIRQLVRQAVMDGAREVFG